MSEDPAVAARGQALAALARREHSRTELERKLAARGHDATAVATALDTLAEQQLQDDKRFVESFVRTRVARGQGPVRISQELRQRGIQLERARAVLDSDEYDWQALARGVLQRQFKAPPADLRAKARQIRFLEYRGFTAAQIGAALKGAADWD